MEIEGNYQLDTKNFLSKEEKKSQTLWEEHNFSKEIRNTTITNKNPMKEGNNKLADNKEGFTIPGYTSRGYFETIFSNSTHQSVVTDH